MQRRGRHARGLDGGRRKLPAGCQFITLASRLSILDPTALAAWTDARWLRLRGGAHRRGAARLLHGPVIDFAHAFGRAVGMEEHAICWRRRHWAAARRRWRPAGFHCCGSACRRHRGPGNGRHKVRRRRPGGPARPAWWLADAGYIRPPSGRKFAGFVQRQDRLAVGVAGGAIMAVAVAWDGIGHVARPYLAPWSSPAPARSDPRTGTGRRRTRWRIGRRA